MSEPVGVMKCFECIEKHARDLEHHLEDLIRSTPDPQKRLRYEEAIDFIRNLRREAHTEAKGIATEPVTESESEDAHSNPEPLRVERGEKVWVEVYHEKEECHEGSFRVVKPNPEHVLTVCCPAGQWDETRPVGQQCVVGMMAQKLEHLHPEGQGSCPVCGGA